MTETPMYRVEWWSPSKYFSMEPRNYPEQTRFETHEEIVEICKSQQLRAKVFGACGVEWGITFEDGSYQHHF